MYLLSSHKSEGHFCLTLLCCLEDFRVCLVWLLVRDKKIVIFFLHESELNIAVTHMKQCLAAEQWLHSTTQRASILPFLFHSSFSARRSDFAYPLSNQGVERERKKGRKKIKGDRERRESKQANEKRKEASASQVAVGTLSSNDIVALLHSYGVSSSFRHDLCVS